MKQAFLMMAHKNEEQTKRLIEWIADENHEVYVHIDQKNEVMFNELSRYFKGNPHVFFVEQRVSVNWSGFSQVLAMVNLLKQTVGKTYDFYHLISGQDLLIKSKQEISDFLKGHKGHQFLEIEENKDYWRIKGYYPLTDCKYSRTFPIRKLNEYLAMFYKKFPVRRNLKGLRVYKGANWFTLSGDCVKYILHYLEQHPDYIRQFKYTMCADEHFIQTLIMNSPFKQTVINNTLREIQWGGVENPKTYTTADCDLLLKSSALFARKFDATLDNEVIDWVYQRDVEKKRD